jgi:hypothetical protein
MRGGKKSQLHGGHPDSEVFSKNRLANIFRIDSKNPERINRHESKWLEFKQSFNWGSKEKYGRTMAAFANTSGGYVVFGVGNSPRTLIGLQNERFDQLDPAVISDFLNNTFVPEIQWETFVYQFQGKQFGLIYVFEAVNKPIISTRSAGDDIKEGEIYYRYHGRSERIKYPELKEMIEVQRKRELNTLLQHVKQIDSIGVQNAAVLNTVDGTIVGPGGKIFIDESLLSNISFIREGQFRGKEGKQAVRIVGEAQVVSHDKIQPVRKVYVSKAIRTEDVVHAFLEQRKVDNPINYIKQLCFETTGYLPIYYFINQSGMSISQIIEIVQETRSTFPNKKKIIKRLTSDANLSIRADTKGRAAERRKPLRERILAKRIDRDLDITQVKYTLQAIRTLKRDEIDRNYVFPFVKEWFDLYYGDRSVDLSGDLRSTICYMDIVFYKDAIRK